MIARSDVCRRALQLICGSVGDLFDHLGCQDVVAVHRVRRDGCEASHARQRDRAPQRALRRGDGFAQLLDPRAGCRRRTRRVLDSSCSEVAREMTVKAGQKCTAIRKALVPKAMLGEVVAALRRSLRRPSSATRASQASAWGRSRASRSATRCSAARRRSSERGVGAWSRGDADGSSRTGGDSRQGALPAADPAPVPRRREGARRAFGRSLRSGLHRDRMTTARATRSHCARRGEAASPVPSSPRGRVALPPNSSSGLRLTTGACWS